MVELWIVLSLVAAFFTGVKDVLSKKVFKRNVKGMQVIFEEYFLLFFVVLILFFYKVDFLSFFDLWYLYLIKAFTLFYSVFLYLKLLKSYEISQVSPLMNLSPVFLVFLSSFFLGENLSVLQFLGIATIIVCTYFLEVNVHLHHTKRKSFREYFSFFCDLNMKFVGFSFLMLFLISICAVCDKMIFNAGAGVFTNMYFSSGIIFMAMVFYFLKKGCFVDVLMKIRSEPQVLLISVLVNLGTFFVLSALAMPSAMVSLVVPIKRTATLFSSILGGVLFHESHLVKKACVTFGMLLGVFLIAF